MKRRDVEEHVGKEAMGKEVEGSRGRVRSKTRWKDCKKNLLKNKNIDEGAYKTHFREAFLERFLYHLELLRWRPEKFAIQLRC